MQLGFQYYISILFILGLLLVFMFFLYKFMNMMNFKSIKNKRAKIIEYLPLQPQVGLYLVNIDGHDKLIGVGNKTIQYIDDIEKKDFSAVLKKTKRKASYVSY